MSILHTYWLTVAHLRLGDRTRRARTIASCLQDRAENRELPLQPHNRGSTCERGPRAESGAGAYTTWSVRSDRQTANGGNRDRTYFCRPSCTADPSRFLRRKRLLHPSYYNCVGQSEPAKRSRGDKISNYTDPNADPNADKLRIIMAGARDVQTSRYTCI